MKFDEDSKVIVEWAQINYGVHHLNINVQNFEEPDDLTDNMIEEPEKTPHFF